MDKYFNKDFKEFFNTLNDFGKKLILWCSVSNGRCPEEHYKMVLNTVESYNKKGLRDNYLHKGNNNNNLKIFTNEEGERLRKKIKELDGTLLTDIVFKSLENHNIFV